jgi:ABC-2 type transport system permease protein
MRLMSEERKTKTEQLLLTAPVSLSGMVFAKFLAAYTLFAGAFLLSCLNFITLYMFGNPNTMAIITSSVGALFIGAAFIAIGLFVSCLSENQFVSAVFTIASLAVFLVLSMTSDSSVNAGVRSVLKWVSIYDRYYYFTSGLFDLTAIIYYSSLCFVFLFLSVRLYEKRRWS